MTNIVPFETLPDLSPMGEQALALASYGLYVFPLFPLIADSLVCSCPAAGNCGSPGKHPLVKSGLKVATTDTNQIRKWWRKYPKANIGVNCELSALLVVDQDPRNGGEASLERIESEHGSLPATYEVETGGGGRHFYYSISVPAKSAPIAPGVDIKSKGGYVVAPGSLHKSGRLYIAQHLGNARPFIVDAPSWLVTLCTKPAPVAAQPPKPARVNPVDVTRGLFGAALAEAGWLGEARPQFALCRCPFESTHTSGTTLDSSTVVYPPENKGINGWIDCKHSHCANRTHIEFWNAIPEEARQRAQRKLAVSPLYEPGASAQPDWLTNWRSELLFENNGKMKRVLGNASLILRNHDNFRGCLGYDEFADRYEWLREPPKFKGLEPIPAGPVKDVHFLQIAFWLASKYDMPEFSSDNIFQIMRDAAVPFHPVKKYLGGLEWDQKPRVRRWLTTYLGVNDCPYAQAIGSWWLVSAIARIMQPGCKADHVLILEGAQGTRKSTALRTLAHPWFADTPINLDSKDAYGALRGVWIYELQELQSLSKADSDKAKAFFSSPVDTYRKPYDRTTVEIQRQCVFAGTVNYNTYLKDGSGNRRYWPVVTDAIAIELLAHDRDQLWAEALHMYNLGSRWHPQTQTEHELCGLEQDLRQQVDEDPLCVPLRAALESMPAYGISVNDLLPMLPGLKNDIKDAIRVARCLASMGWQKYKGDAGRNVWRLPKTDPKE